MRSWPRVQSPPSPALPRSPCRTAAGSLPQGPGPELSDASFDGGRSARGALSAPPAPPTTPHLICPPGKTPPALESLLQASLGFPCSLTNPSDSPRGREHPPPRWEHTEAQGGASLAHGLQLVGVRVGVGVGGSGTQAHTRTLRFCPHGTSPINHRRRQTSSRVQGSPPSQTPRPGDDPPATPAPEPLPHPAPAHSLLCRTSGEALRLRVGPGAPRWLPLLGTRAFLQRETFKRRESVSVPRHMLPQASPNWLA